MSSGVGDGVLLPTHLTGESPVKAPSSEMPVDVNTHPQQSLALGGRKGYGETNPACSPAGASSTSQECIELPSARKSAPVGAPGWSPIPHSTLAALFSVEHLWVGVLLVTDPLYPGSSRALRVAAIVEAIEVPTGRNLRCPGSAERSSLSGGCSWR